MENQVTIDHAKKLMAEKDYEKAALIFLEIFTSVGDKYAGTRYISCLRRLSQEGAKTAVNFARKYHGDLREQPWYNVETGWALFYGPLKEIIDEEKVNYSSAVQIGKSILKLIDSVPEEMQKVCDHLRIQTVIAIVKLAKMKSRWQDLLDFAGTLNIEQVPGEPRIISGRRVPSVRETLINHQLRALMALARYEEASNFAEKGLLLHATNPYIKLWKARALINLGDRSRALALLVELDTRHPNQWYVQFEIGQALAIEGNNEKALFYLCKAAILPGEIDPRIGLYEALADLFEVLGDLDAVSDHLLLAWSIADSKSWQSRKDAVRARLDEFVKRQPVSTVAVLGLPNFLSQSSKSYKACRQYWQRVLSKNIVRQKGTVETWNEVKAYGFIRNETGESLFFSQRHITKNGWIPTQGESVIFTQQEGYDHKKQRESLIAVLVQPAM